MDGFHHELSEDDMILSQVFETLEDEMELRNDDKPEEQGQGVESRFAEMTDHEIDTLIEDTENKNTKKATKWAVNVYQDWKNSIIGSGLIIPNLKDLSVQDINSI
ncbi:Hypothetical predicted protein [Mytilus galloprovincialis]|uniref:Uncharacterized protein n=1 Tax=Mytilus galloprovincialis TaxID=29158 RepID=A0A8B6EK34_MYTGA|nr:Hypothetical predicted protein [Mytilus galloprovincialis]